MLTAMQRLCTNGYENLFLYLINIPQECIFSNQKMLGKREFNEVKKELAGFLAQLHQIKGTYFGYFTENPKQQYATWKEAFLQMFEMVLRDGKQHQVRLPYERIRKVLKQYEKTLDALDAPSLVEYDCHEGNIFVKKTEGTYHIEGILDFEGRSGAIRLRISRLHLSLQMISGKSRYF